MKPVKQIYIYNESTMPEEGWLQGCFECGAITSKLLLFKTKEGRNHVYEYLVFICYTCDRTFKRDTTRRVAFLKECRAQIS